MQVEGRGETAIVYDPALPKEQDGNGTPIRRTHVEVLGDQTVGRDLTLRGGVGTRMDTGTSTKVIRAQGTTTIPREIRSRPTNRILGMHKASFQSLHRGHRRPRPQ
jgi:hypothetical protein